MESFEHLYRQYTPLINGLMNSLHIYKNKEEFFQLGLIGLWKARNQFNGSKGDFTSYAYTTIRGLFLTELTKHNRESQTATPATDELLNAFQDNRPSPVLEKELLQSYCAAGHLTKNQTKWVFHHCLDKMTIKEISAKENVSPSAVKQWRAGAKEKLKNAILSGQMDD
ncbi:sigma-70 family RNA polymerase sigma factor [Bacillus massilinigeriensis]|uniref:sigma-70 family RNA polymerase sigma factor n=1 Tax=Bacillus mediterraneensis TaxID=1805474 RepID=UPI0008F912FE|nr:sigma-70 family RNA polymerase sigma factor [Bacillus mediterraneensis]